MSIEHQASGGVLEHHRLVALQRKFASLVYRRPLPLLETLNNHARLCAWLKTQSAPRFDSRFALHDHVNREFIGNEPINYLEFGVYEGNSFAHWMSINQHPDSRFWGFDTFTGLPEDWSQHFRQGHFDAAGHAPNLDDSRGCFVKGLFQETLPSFLRDFDPHGRQLVIHNDSDLYSSTIYTLTTLNNLIVPGTIIIFDEFASPMHEFRAWNEYLGAFMREATLIGYTDDYATQAAFRFD